MVPTLGGVHKIQILVRDLLKEILQKIFGEEMGGSGGPRPPYYLFETSVLKKRREPTTSQRLFAFECMSNLIGSLI